MALFSRLRGQNSNQPNQLDQVARALLTPSVYVAAADGKLENSEIDQICSMCAFNPVFQTIGAARTHELIKDILAKFGHEDVKATFEQTAAALDQPMRETAIAFAIRVSIADGHLDEMEHKTMVAFAVQFGVEPEQFNKMLDVLAMLQRAPRAA